MFTLLSIDFFVISLVELDLTRLLRAYGQPVGGSEDDKRRRFDFFIAGMALP